MSADSPAINTESLNIETPRNGIPMLPEGSRDSIKLFNAAIKVLDHLAPYPVVENIGYNEPSDVTLNDGDTFWVDAAADESWDNKDDCYALYITEDITDNNGWWFIDPARSMFCVPLANAGSSLSPIRPYQRTSATTNTWAAIS